MDKTKIPVNAFKTLLHKLSQVKGILDIDFQAYPHYFAYIVYGKKKIIPGGPQTLFLCLLNRNGIPRTQSIAFFPDKGLRIIRRFRHKYVHLIKTNRIKNMMSKKELRSLAHMLNEIEGVHARLSYMTTDETHKRWYYIPITFGEIRFEDMINAFGKLAFYNTIDTPKIRRLYPTEALQIIAQYQAKYVYHDKNALKIDINKNISSDIKRLKRDVSISSSIQQHDSAKHKIKDILRSIFRK